jgi:glycosyltransferase involved in cell wall biosynthesis
MPDPLVSIVLPTYNGARYLPEAIRTCLDQTYRNIELVVVDDASTDGTPEVLASVGDPRLRVIRHEVNRKLPGALNTGFAAARGDYLTWTSDDNRYMPVAVERMLTYLQARPDTAFVCAGYVFINPDGSRADRPPRAPGPIWLLPVRNVIGACFLYRREVAEKIGPYNESCFLAEDYEYWLRVQRRFRIGVIPEPLYEYRQHETSLSSTYEHGRIVDAAERAKLAAWAKEPWPVRRWLMAQAKPVLGYLVCQWVNEPLITARKAMGA